MISGTRRMVLAAVVWMPWVAIGEELPLPAWEARFARAADSAEFLAGEQVLSFSSDDLALEETDEILLELEQLEQAVAGELAEEWVPLREIGREWIGSYFDSRPASLLVDPQKLLPEAVFRDQVEFLKYHADDSTINLQTYVFAADQEIPGEVQDEELMEWHYSSGRPTAVVFYYLGAPERSELRLSASLTDLVPWAEQRRALESSVSIASEKRTPEEQLEAFLVQMSIRVYWMERIMARDARQDAEVTASPQTLAEKPENSAAGQSSAAFWILAITSAWGAPLAGALGLAIGISGFGLWWRYRARFLFPEIEVEPRLGGSHAAGIGAVISFSSASVPPASQRQQVPDYLRRA